MNNRLRIAVFQRDGYRCVYCGVTAADARLQADHFIPKTLGGKDRMDNLVTACFECNNGKGKTLGKVPDGMEGVLSPGRCIYGCSRPPEVLAPRMLGGYETLIPFCHDHHPDGPTISTLYLGYSM